MAPARPACWKRCICWVRVVVSVSGGHEAVIARGSAALQVYAEIDTDGRQDRLGFERARSSWRALRNGERVADLAELATLVPVVCFSPESHELIGGGAEVRRRFMTGSCSTWNRSSPKPTDAMPDCCASAMRC